MVRPTEKSAKKPTRRGRSRAAAGTLAIGRGHDCHLLCFSPEYPPQLSQMVVLEILNLARRKAPGGPEWLMFAGESPMHWSRLTQWMLFSTAVGPEVFDKVCDQVRGIDMFGHFECTELTTPGREPFIAPLFSIQDDGPKLLVAPETVDPKWENEVAGVVLRQRGWRWA